MLFSWSWRLLLETSKLYREKIFSASADVHVAMLLPQSSWRQDREARLYSLKKNWKLTSAVAWLAASGVMECHKDFKYFNQWP